MVASTAAATIACVRGFSSHVFKPFRHLEYFRGRNCNEKRAYEHYHAPRKNGVDENVK
jgi:hypothetical protein